MRAMSAQLVCWSCVVLAQTVVAQQLVVPNASELTIVTRETADTRDAPVQTWTVRRKGARQRLDWVSGREGRSQPAHRSTSIVQCDERRTILLNHEAKTFAVEPIESPAETARRIPRTRIVSPIDTTGGDVTMTIDVVDTGERRTLGPYAARRVRTTTTVVPGPGARTLASVREQDGWYLDLPSASCLAADVNVEGFLNNGADRVHVERRGPARTGYAIEETDRVRDDAFTSVRRVELIEFSEARIDAALFRPPATYRPALPLPSGGYDFTKPDTLPNRLRAYWDVVVAWTRAMLR